MCTPIRSLIGREVGTLHIERICHCIAGSCERGDEAIALTLFDWAYPAVFGNELRGRPIQAGDGLGHGVRLGLPELSRALDVGEQQRHRAGRQQLGHGNLGPVSRAHASQHPSTGHGQNISPKA